MFEKIYLRTIWITSNNFEMQFFKFLWRDLIIQKYLRLAVPYLAAIVLAILCSWIASHWMSHDSISQLPDLAQLVSHLFFLQNILGYESLSAGLWYVAIDFQLFNIILEIINVIVNQSERMKVFNSGEFNKGIIILTFR